MIKACVLGLVLTTTVYSAELAPLSNFERTPGSLHILAPCVPHTPWTVAGEHGALFGRQNGVFEAWEWPIKILSNFAIRAELANYPVPIDVNTLAAEILVTPAETTITYSHAAFTLRQHMFAPRGSGELPTGAVAFFEIESVRPLQVTFSFTPEMQRMWPAPSFGRPNGEWLAQGESGLYVLHTDDPHFSALIAMPRTRPGILVPYQEHPQKFPLELKLSFDPERDHGMVYPLIMSVLRGNPKEQSISLDSAIPQLYSQTQEYYAHFFDSRVTAETPERRIDEALQWAEIAVDQMQVKYHDEIGMVAGYYESADSARPGYAWFFGRDTLWTTYAINSYGDFALTRRALDFLIHRQREDGKIMHEFSQSADAVDWKATPYFYASADATPLLVMAVDDYVKTSGDTEYLRRNWEAVRKAYAFTRAHESDDGIYNNSQGTGWVESWPPGMPHQEIYLAALDQQSSKAVAQLARLIPDNDLAIAAEKKAAEIAGKIESEYYDSPKEFYAFSRGVDGSLDTTATIYPSVAWWDGTLSLAHAGPMLTRWASNEFSTDWGTRDISPQTPFYDPISYHQGSIWPLFTGWVSLAEYRAGRPLSAYAHMMQNANLTWAQDLGSVTELLSGEFFEPLGRSSSHQMWSSAMIITPLLRGLFGIGWDAQHSSLHLMPHLPADWDRARLRNVPLNGKRIDLDYQRKDGQLMVTSTSGLHSTFPLPAVEVAIPAHLPEEGSTTQQLKVLNEEYRPTQAVFAFEAPAGSQVDLAVRLNRAGVHIKGAVISGTRLHIQFPGGQGYQREAVTFIW